VSVSIARDLATSIVAAAAVYPASWWAIGRVRKVFLNPRRDWRTRVGACATYGIAGLVFLYFAIAQVDQVWTRSYAAAGVVVGVETTWLSTISLDGRTQSSHSSSMLVRVPHGKFSTSFLKGPISVEYRVGRFTGRVYPSSIAELPTHGR